MRAIKHFLVWGLALQLCAGIASADSGRGQDDAVAVFAGIATDTAFVESMFAPWSNEFEEIGVVGAAYSRRLGSVGALTGWGDPGGVLDDFTIEGEVGVSARFGEEHLGEVWTGLYLRYDGFFWNDVVYTTIAVNTGVSYITDLSEFERGRDENNKNTNLLHYMGPEITFASPDNKDLELLVRFHHRSGVFGAFDGVISGSTFISTGVRVRF